MYMSQVHHCGLVAELAQKLAVTVPRGCLCGSAEPHVEITASCKLCISRFDWNALFLCACQLYLVTVLDLLQEVLLRLHIPCRIECTQQVCRTVESMSHLQSQLGL